MNDIAHFDERIRRELMIAVERAVRPVRASLASKRRMREELLAHLTAIYEEEAAKPGGGQAALENAARRFGDPRALSLDLQQTVGRWNRFLSLLEWLNFRPAESPLHFAGRPALATFLGFIVLLPPALLELLVRGKQRELGAVAETVLILACVISIFVFGFLFGLVHVARAFQGNDSQRSRARTSLYCAASLAFFPSLAFATYFSLTGNLTASLVHLRFGWYFAPLGPAVFLLASRQMAEEMRHAEEWGGLEIES